MSLITVALLYLSFRLKQLLCDFFLQPSWMALIKNQPLTQGGAKALFMHVGIHAVFTLIIMMIFAPAYWWLAAVDFNVHALIDKSKAAINNKMGWTYKDAAYWWSFGLDQEAHNLTHLVYIIILVTNAGGISH